MVIKTLFGIHLVKLMGTYHVYTNCSRDDAVSRAFNAELEKVNKEGRALLHKSSAF